MFVHDKCPATKPYNNMPEFWRPTTRYKTRVLGSARRCADSSKELPLRCLRREIRLVRLLRLSSGRLTVADFAIHHREGTPFIGGNLHRRSYANARDEESSTVTVQRFDANFKNNKWCQILADR